MLCTVVGARPNFVKMAPVVLEARRRGIPQVFVHTGQHYDERMSRVFFEELGMPQPDEYLGVGSGSHAEQTARVMVEFERVCLAHRPRCVVVAGDVNSTLACALVASKLQIEVAHVESGLRSFDRTMPEEINRILTDHLAQILFTTEESGARNLLAEGVNPDKIHFVGNTMIDSLRTHLGAARAAAPWEALGLTPGGFGLVTLHRPANVDSPEAVRSLAEALAVIGREMPLLFPVHPRTLAAAGSAFERVRGLRIVEPLPYLDFLGLMSEARVVLTDSGGIQEETTALGTWCMTLRPNTERPCTVQVGTNELVQATPEAVEAAFHRGPPRAGVVPPLWDGHAATRLVDVLERRLESSEG